MQLVIKSKRNGSKTVLFDDEDFDLIKNYHWCVAYTRGVFYCVASVTIDGKQRQKKMHRIIMGVDDPSIHIDHKSMDGLDNRKSNLRVATIAQNTRNVGPNKRNTTGYKGVYMYKEGNGNAGRYTATLRFNGKIIHGGYFNTIADAAEKYNQMSLKYHGEFGFINKITDEDLLKRQQYVKVKKYRQCKNKYTGLYGVSPFNIGIKNKFKSVIRVNSKHIHIGYFKTAEEAAIAYDNIALKLIGAGAKLNNP